MNPLLEHDALGGDFFIVISLPKLVPKIPFLQNE